MDPSKQFFINAFFSNSSRKSTVGKSCVKSIRTKHSRFAWYTSIGSPPAILEGRKARIAGISGVRSHNLTGNPLFGMIHPRQLEELTQRYYPSAVPFISSLVNRQPNALLKESDVVAEIRKSSLLDSEKQELIENLWRASMANIAYDFIRVAEVHGPGSGGLK